MTDASSAAGWRGERLPSLTLASGAARSLVRASQRAQQRTPHSVVLAFPFRWDELAVLRAEVAGSLELRYCDQASTLMQTIAEVRPALVLVAVRDRTGGPMAPTIRRIREAFPRTPVVAYCDLTYAHLRGAVEVGAAGVEHVIVRGYDNVSGIVRQVVAEAYRSEVADIIIDELRPLDVELLRWMIRYCTAHAHERLSVERVAHARGVSPGTVHNELRRHGLGTPGRIISWCRLLAAAYRLEEPGCAVRQIARELGFSSASELRMMLKRYTALRPGEIRASGGLRLLARCFRSELLEIAAGVSLPVTTERTA